MDGRRSRAGVGAFALAALCLLLLGCGGGNTPKPAPVTESPTESSVPRETEEAPADLEPEVDSYRILVNDELSVNVLGYPELNGSVRVLPDGTIGLPGIGSVFVLGMTAGQLAEKLETQMKSIARYPQVTVTVTNFGERKVFVLGDVNVPGSQTFQRSLTVLGAIAQAGGFLDTGRKSSVVLLRRTGTAEAVAQRIDLTGPLEGKSLEKDLFVEPFDIIYVPKTFIGSVGVLMEQYFRPFIAPFSLYLEGWNAFHADDTNVRFIAR